MDHVTLRSQQRLIVTIVALIFGPIFMLGPLLGALCLLIFAPLNFFTVFATLPLVGASAFFAYHMGQNYHWVELDGDWIRGRRFWTRQLVEHRVEEITEVVPLGSVVKNEITHLTDALLGSIRGYEIRFRTGPSMALIRYDMKNVDEMVKVLLDQLYGPDDGQR